MAKQYINSLNIPLSSNHENKGKKVVIDGIQFLQEGNELIADPDRRQLGEYQRLPVMTDGQTYYIQPFPCLDCGRKLEPRETCRIWVYRIRYKNNGGRWLDSWKHDPMCLECQKKIVVTPNHHPFEYHPKVIFPLMWLPKCYVVAKFHIDLKLSDLWTSLLNLRMGEIKENE